MLRSVAAGICLILVCLLVPVSATAWWLRTTVTDTDEFVDTVGPLASDPEVQAAAERLLVGRVMTAVERRGLLPQVQGALDDEALPRPLRRALRGSEQDLQARVERLVTSTTRTVLASPQFAEAWEESVRLLHEQLIGLLSGTAPPESARAGRTISLELAVLGTALRNALVDAGLPGAERLPAVEATLPVADAEQLQRAQEAYRLLDRWGLWLPWVTAGLLVLGLLVTRRPTPSLGWTGLGTAVAVLGTAGALLVLGPSVVTSQVPAAGRAAAGRVVEIVTGELLTLLWWLAGISVGVAILAGLWALLDPTTER